MLKPKDNLNLTIDKFVKTDFIQVEDDFDRDSDDLAPSYQLTPEERLLVD